LVGGSSKRTIGQSVLTGNNRSVPRMCSRKMNGERAHWMSAEDSVAGDDDLKLVHKMKVWRNRCSGFLLDQERLRLPYLKRLRISVFWRLCIDELFGAPRWWRTDKLGPPDNLSVSGD